MSIPGASASVKTEARRTQSRIGTSVGKRKQAGEVSLTTPRAKKPSVDRPKTSQDGNAAKQWRQARFQKGGPASRREVELLGEWLNSVLADNLDAHENPLDIVTNAQHWFSVAFNELVRQVAVTCAERGRLFAVIWKRNQDLFSKLSEIQRDEREYILSCHKDRVQFLKTDLDFARSRFAKIDTAYAEEQVKWKESKEKDITKFDSLQSKIDQQVADRKAIQAEIRALQAKLGIHVQEEETSTEVEVSDVSYSRDELDVRLQTMKTRIRLGDQPVLSECAELVDNVTHFLDTLGDTSLKIRQRFEHMFLSIPVDRKPITRPMAWMNMSLAYIYSLCIHAISQGDYEETKKIELLPFTYDCFLNFCGNRRQTEELLMDLLFTAKQYMDEGNSRATLFLRCIGLFDPVPLHMFHFYLFCLAMLAKTGSAPLFPEVETQEQMIGGIPTSICCDASQKILTRFTEGRILKFHTERIDKIANGSYLKFGGKAIAEPDTILEYLIAAYVEEVRKVEATVQDNIDKLPNKQIASFGDIHALMPILKAKPTHAQLAEVFERCMHDVDQFPVTGETFRKVCGNAGFTVPFELTRNDFVFEPASDDLKQFVSSVFAIYLPEYEDISAKLTESKDEILLKQLKASKVKYEQALAGRSSVKLFESSVRELFEKMELIRFHVGRTSH